MALLRRRRLFAALISLAAFGPAAAMAQVAVTYRYDSLGRVVSAATGSDTATGYCYDAAGNRTIGDATKSSANPKALTDTVSLSRNTSLSFDPRSNDTGTLSFTVVSVTAPCHGSAVISGGNITYTPTSGYWGPDSFTYSIKDTNNVVAWATVIVNVN